MPSVQIKNYTRDIEMTAVVAVRVYEVYGRSQASTLKHGSAPSRACFERGNGNAGATLVRDSAKLGMKRYVSRG
jgi:hypothetical protein